RVSNRRNPQRISRDGRTAARTVSITLLLGGANALADVMSTLKIVENVWRLDTLEMHKALIVMCRSVVSTSSRDARDCLPCSTIRRAVSFGGTLGLCMLAACALYFPYS